MTGAGSLGIFGALGAALFTLFVLVTFFVLAVRKTRARGPHASELDTTGRSLLSSLSTLRVSLASLVADLRNVPELKSLLDEVEKESDHAYEQASTLLEARTALQRTLKGRATALQKLGEADSLLQGEKDPEARASLESALASRRAEVAGYRAVEDRIRGIEAKLRQAEAGLAELQSKLVTATSMRTGSGEAESELGGLADRLRNLSGTLDEATEFLEGSAQ
ncbi:MAG: hypothetical protein AB7F50_09875 [Fimbriimonadaceae bacterium]